MTFSRNRPWRFRLTNQEGVFIYLLNHSLTKDGGSRLLLLCFAYLCEKEKQLVILIPLKRGVASGRFPLAEYYEKKLLALTFYNR